MKEDSEELTPGSKVFWDSFYDPENGRLQEKNESNRKAEELRSGGSLLNHYEWFMQYDCYADALSECVSGVVSVSTGTPGDEFHVLHVGCGNSDFCDHFADDFAGIWNGAKASTRPVVLNVDISPGIICHLRSAFPDRLYAVGDCCYMAGDPAPGAADDGWYRMADGGDGAALEYVRKDSVDLVFDKGTADALLSAFPGELNPNVVLYASETLRVLRPGGLFFIISINSEDNLCQYFLACSEDDKYYELAFRKVILLDKKAKNHLRVETLGTVYNCFGFRVVSDTTGGE